MIWWCLGAAVEELGGWASGGFLWLLTAHKRGGREGKELKDLSCSKVPIRCITPPFYKGRQEWKLVLHKHTWLSHVAKWKETSPKWLHGWMGGHEWPRERWRARWHSTKERKKRLDGPFGPFCGIRWI